VTTTVTEAVNDFSVATSSGAWVDLRLYFDNAKHKPHWKDNDDRRH
jgi:hypothetical protein